MPSSTLPEASKKKYLAVARLTRAYSYYMLVRQYGDVEWIDGVINNPEDERIYGERTSRDVVMDNVLADLDYAIENLGAASDHTQWNKDMALAMKSEVCLFEGTFRKYCSATENGLAPKPERAQKYLQESQKASEALMNGTYSLMDKYGDIYTQIDLVKSKEASSIVIMRRTYSDTDWLTIPVVLPFSRVSLATLSMPSSSKMASALLTQVLAKTIRL